MKESSSAQESSEGKDGLRFLNTGRERGIVGRALYCTALSLLVGYVIKSSYAVSSLCCCELISQIISYRAAAGTVSSSREFSLLLINTGFT
jgi:hypothetical protein